MLKISECHVWPNMLQFSDVEHIRMSDRQILSYPMFGKCDSILWIGCQIDKFYLIQCLASVKFVISSNMLSLQKIWNWKNPILLEDFNLDYIRWSSGLIHLAYQSKQWKKWPKCFCNCDIKRRTSGTVTVNYKSYQKKMSNIYSITKK